MIVMTHYYDSIMEVQSQFRGNIELIEFRKWLKKGVLKCSKLTFKMNLSFLSFSNHRVNLDNFRKALNR